jgi:uncharacterized protein with PIN domain
MLITHCSLLGKNAQLLRELYDKRDKLIARDGSASELKAAEYDLIRMHKILKRHRTRCPQCKLNESFMSASEMRIKPLPRPLLNEAPFLPIQVQ